VSTVGLAEGRCAAAFPSPAALVATFNRTLWRTKGLQDAKHGAASAIQPRGRPPRRHEQPDRPRNGWGPSIDTVRDPKYGRNSELEGCSDIVHRPVKFDVDDASWDYLFASPEGYQEDKNTLVEGSPADQFADYVMVSWQHPLAPMNKHRSTRSGRF
jgi:hypothetical protein